jgi:hypothetical protein
VRYQTHEQAARAICAMHLKMVGGRVVRVCESLEISDRSSVPVDYIVRNICPLTLFQCSWGSKNDQQRPNTKVM